MKTLRLLFCLALFTFITASVSSCSPEPLDVSEQGTNGNTATVEASRD